MILRVRAVSKEGRSHSHWAKEGHTKVSKKPPAAVKMTTMKLCQQMLPPDPNGPAKLRWMNTCSHIARADLGAHTA